VNSHHYTHANSAQSFHTLNREQRRDAVKRVYEVHGSLTDREVAMRLGYSDLNCVRPRITEMISDGVLVECGAKVDMVSGKRVRLVRIRLIGEDHQPELFGAGVFNINSGVRKIKDWC